MSEITNVEEVVKMMTEVKKMKTDLIAKMKAVAQLDEEIVRVSSNLRRQESPSQLHVTYTCRAWKNK